MNDSDTERTERMACQALARINNAIIQYKPIAVFGLFSGGHDSVTATKLASLLPRFTAAVHINTGIGIEATRTYVYETAVQHRWTLKEYRAMENVNAKGEPDPQDYDRMVLEHGFPGPPGHGMMYVRLKERGLRRLEREYGASMRSKNNPLRVMYISGCRSEESERRMGTVKEVQVDGRRIWMAPIHDWTKFDCHRYMQLANIARSPVVDAIHKSGECLCGAFAHPGELEELLEFGGELCRPAYDRIKALEEKVKAAGHTWGWEGRAPKRPKSCGIDPQQQFLCMSCNRNAETV